MSWITPGARRAALSALVALLLIAGCGDDDGGGTVVKDAAPVCEKAKVAAAEGKPTTVEMPARPVTTLEQQDLRPGTGPEAVVGKQLTVNYVGVSCLSGLEFDSSWGKGQPDPKTSKPGDEPLPFVIGRGQVIKGWEQGLVGMKVGGRRRLVIPGDLAYGPNGNPQGGIAPNDTLVFIVDLLDVAEAPPETTAPATTAPPTTPVPGATTVPPPAPDPGSTTAPPGPTTVPPTTVPPTTVPPTTAGGG